MYLNHGPLAGVQGIRQMTASGTRITSPSNATNPKTAATDVGDVAPDVLRDPEESQTVGFSRGHRLSPSSSPSAQSRIDVRSYAAVIEEQIRSWTKGIGAKPLSGTIEAALALTPNDMEGKAVRARCTEVIQAMEASMAVQEQMLRERGLAEPPDDPPGYQGDFRS